MRTLNIGDNIYGFEVLRIAPLAELSGELVEMVHLQTGLKLAWLRREEENKTFGITFQTLPENDTGVFHILEHSVLCGSDRYPVKEPFVELLKSSLNTFLNALTFPDKTMYPIATRNAKDFMNLSRVYLDAVFHPAIYHNPSIFRQEGWHYAGNLEMRKPTGSDDLHYEGVVYNEMRGAFADPDELAENEMERALYPDTPYAYVSGGDPAKIPELTYEEFLDCHRRFYAPSNAFVFLDGDVPLDEFLQMLQEEYLAGFTDTGRVPVPALQKACDAGVREVAYEVGEGEDIGNKVRLAFGRVLGTYADREILVAMNILTEVLAGSNQSYLPAKILAAGLAEDVNLRVTDGILQPRLNIEVKNLREADIENVKNVLFGEIRRLAEEGIDHDRIEAAMANEEFMMRERDYGSYPQGLIFGFQMMESWMYGGAPEANLEIGDLFKNLRAKMEDGYFEQLLQELILDNPHRAEIHLLPSKTLAGERRSAEREKMEAIAASWSDEDRTWIMEENAERTAWQESEDAPEDLAKIPHLSIADLTEGPEWYPTEESKIGDVTLLRHPVATAGIVYVSLFLPLKGYAPEELSEASFMASLLGKVGTKSSTADALQIREQLIFGNVTAGVTTYGKNNRADVADVYLLMTASFLEEKEQEAYELLTEILLETEFAEEQEIHDLLRQSIQRQKQSFLMGGHLVGAMRLNAMCTKAGAVQECLSGLTYYRWQKAADAAWNPEKLSTLPGILRDILTEDGAVLSITADETYEEGPAATRFVEAIAGYKETHRAGRTGREASVEPLGLRKEGIAIPADITFATMGRTLTEVGGAYSGQAILASRICSLHYLWNTIRVQGGAYGAGTMTRPSGFVCGYSYRDPDGARSLGIYPQIGSFLREFAQSEPDLTGSIIGAVSDMMQLLSPRMKGSMQDVFRLRGVTKEYREALYQELVHATPADLLEMTDAYEKLFADAGVCLIGPKAQLEQAGVEIIEEI